MGLFPFCSFPSLIFATILLLGFANGQQESSSRFDEPHHSISITSANGVTNTISHQFPKNFNDVRNRIALGVPDLLADKAVAKEFPWIVYIEAGFTKHFQCSPNSSYTHRWFISVGNGVLINNQWILASASGLHARRRDAEITPCNNASFQETYTNLLANEVTIFLGAVETKWVYEPQRLVIDSRQFFRHPDYNPEDMEASLPADLALIKLPFPIEFNDFIRPIALPDGVISKNNITNNNLTMVSYGKYVWGDRHESYGTRGDLRKANVLAQPNDECQSTFSKGNLNDSRVACVAGLGFAYFGDEGAAIAQMDDNAGNKDSNNWTLTAIVSRLNYFGREDRPREEVLKMFSVGVKVEPHMGWINYVVNGDSITQSPTVSTTPLYTPSISPTPTGGARNLSILHLYLMVSLLTSSLMLTR